jgi:hypothetical protein
VPDAAEKLTPLRARDCTPEFLLRHWLTDLVDRCNGIIICGLLDNGDRYRVSMSAASTADLVYMREGLNMDVNDHIRGRQEAADA